MNVVIFEDDRSFSIKLEEAIIGLGYNVVLNTDNIESIRKHLFMSDQAEIYLLDILINDIPEGMDAFRLINHSSNQNLCIFLTNYVNYIMYNPELKIKAFSFITKNSITELSQTLSLAAQKIKDHNLLVIEGKYNCISVSLEGIYYLESRYRIVHIFHEKDEFLIRTSLYKLMEKLNDSFLQCHRSYIVNKNKIIGLDKSNQMISLMDGFKCPYSKNRIREWKL